MTEGMNVFIGYCAIIIMLIGLVMWMTKDFEW